MIYDLHFIKYVNTLKIKTFDCVEKCTVVYIYIYTSICNF